MDFSAILELFLNLLEAAAVVASVVTFFVLMLNKYSKALRTILGPCGIGFRARVRALLICRKSQVKKRAFLEYAILQTGGRPVLPAVWHTILNGFKAFYTEGDQGAPTYTLPNCTPLIEKDFSDAAERYFRYFSQEKVKRAFGLQEDPIQWVVRLHIEEAYATPTCLLTGLLSQYNESWEEFIKRYVSTAFLTDGKEGAGDVILSSELYFTFAWLLWGPSYELEYKNYWAGLCQLSYGDESNSVPAVADTQTHVAEELKKKFLENEERRYGALISADVSLYDKKPFYGELRGEINPDNAYFYDKVEGGDLSFGIKIDGFAPCMNYKSKKYYSTAYVWILFELEGEEYSFKPERSVAFFEHTNLADRETYRFLVDALIDKSLKHFGNVFADPANAGRKYRFVCAMNEEIQRDLERKYEEAFAADPALAEALRDRISFEPKHSPSEVFSAYDEFFSMNKDVSFSEVTFDDPRTISDFGRYYTDIYMEAFKDEDERETFDSFLRYLRKGSAATEYRFHIVLAKDAAGRVIGGSVFNYYPKTNAAVIEFIAIRPDLQSGGMGSLLYKHVLSVLSEDAYRMTGQPLDYVFCEIDSPEYSKAEIKKYLYFWDKNNYRHLLFDYVQPALSADQSAVEGLWFIVSPQRGAFPRQVPGKLVSDVLYDYVKYAMSIEDPTSCPQYRKMAEELARKGEIPTERIV